MADELLSEEYVSNHVAGWYSSLTAAEQPTPQPGKQVVGDAVLVDIRQRMELGKQRYGTYLETHNGRDALQDAYDEKLDDVFYTKQYMLEREDLRAQLAHVTAQRDALRRLVCVVQPFLPVLSQVVSMRDEIADAWSEANKAMREGGE